jgi:hypothetical protein
MIDEDKDFSVWSFLTKKTLTGYCYSWNGEILFYLNDLVGQHGNSRGW